MLVAKFINITEDLFIKADSIEAIQNVGGRTKICCEYGSYTCNVSIATVLSLISINEEKEDYESNDKDQFVSL